MNEEFMLWLGGHLKRFLERDGVEFEMAQDVYELFESFPEDTHASRVTEPSVQTWVTGSGSKINVAWNTFETGESVQIHRFDTNLGLGYAWRIDVITRDRGSIGVEDPCFSPEMRALVLAAVGRMAS